MMVRTPCRWSRHRRPSAACWPNTRATFRSFHLVGAAIVSLVIQQWATAIGLIVITLFNALVGLRQAGKAESAMNALQSMMKARARVLRDGTEAGPVTNVWGNCA